MKTFSIKTLGCKVNQCDSQSLRSILINAGLEEVKGDSSSDLCVVNTCCVTAEAERKSRNIIRRGLRQSKATVVSGCYGSYEAGFLKGLGVTKIFGPSPAKDFSAWLCSFMPEASPGKDATGRDFGSRTRAFLKVQDGCDNRCSYCVVPLLRGRSTSVTAKEIISSARELVSRGHKEIVLTGVNLGSFWDSGLDISDLAGELETIGGLERIRLSSIEAHFITEKLIGKISSSKKICPHLHIPFQSGDDEVLRAMNRRLEVSDYLGIVDMARKKIRDLMITCDMIVGFPAEKDSNFDNSLSFIRQVNPLRVHIFPFSPRKGTAAFDYKRIRNDIVKERLSEMSDCAKKTAELCLDSRAGRTMEVLFENKKDGFWRGHSREYFEVRCKCSKDLRNKMKKVRIIKGNKDSFLYGVLSS